MLARAYNDAVMDVFILKFLSATVLNRTEICYQVLLECLSQPIQLIAYRSSVLISLRRRMLAVASLRASAMTVRRATRTSSSGMCWDAFVFCGVRVTISDVYTSTRQYTLG